nr:aspartic acid-rich protein-like [Arachis hypogaea]
MASLPYNVMGFVEFDAAVALSQTDRQSELECEMERMKEGKLCQLSAKGAELDLSPFWARNGRRGAGERSLSLYPSKCTRDRVDDSIDNDDDDDDDADDDDDDLDGNMEDVVTPGAYIILFDL